MSDKRPQKLCAFAACLAESAGVFDVGLPQDAMTAELCQLHAEMTGATPRAAYVDLQENTKP